MRLPTALSALLLMGCPADPGATFEQCELDLVLDLQSAKVGDTVVAQGRPLTEALDTVVRVDGVSAEVVSVDITEDACDTCDACRATAECGVCTSCGDCAESCAECEQTVSFVVPQVPVGELSVSVHNAFGASPALPLTIVDSADDDAGQ